MFDTHVSERPVDRVMLAAVAALVLAGMLIFSSASLGILARSTAHAFEEIALKQLIFTGVIGLGSLALCTLIQPNFWRRAAFGIYIAALIMCLLVFVPGIGFEHGGAKRWLDIFGFSFQPAELLKFGFVTYLAALFSAGKGTVRTLMGGPLVLMGVLAPVAAILMSQPDFGTFAVITASGVAIYIAAGAKLKHVALIAGVLAIAAAGFISAKPYALERVTTFLRSDSDTLGAAYQVNQSVLAIGAGGLAGRGFGQSLQKFHYLPEPVGDSIFAVLGEEFGFIGCAVLIALYLAFFSRSLLIAGRSKDQFGALVCVGIGTLIISQSFLNMASMLEILPLTGVPLVFISQGGSAMVAALAEVGVILAISRSPRVRQV